MGRALQKSKVVFFRIGGGTLCSPPAYDRVLVGWGAIQPSIPPEEGAVGSHCVGKSQWLGLLPDAKSAEDAEGGADMGGRDTHQMGSGM